MESSTLSSSRHVFSHEAVQLLANLHFPLSSLQDVSAPAVVPLDSLSLLDLVLHLNSTYALSFWVLRSLVTEAARRTATGNADDTPYLRDLNAACDTLQHARDVVDKQFGSRVLAPVLLSCLVYYTDSSAYDVLSLRRDVCALLAPGGGPARYCVDDEDEKSSDDAEFSGSERGSSYASDDSADEGGAQLDADVLHETTRSQSATTMMMVHSKDFQNEAAASPFCVSASTRRRWQRERAAVTSQPPPQSDVAVLLLSISKALYEVDRNTTAMTGALSAQGASTALLPWLYPSTCGNASPLAGHKAQDFAHHPRLLSALLRRGQSCLTASAAPPRHSSAHEISSSPLSSRHLWQFPPLSSTNRNARDVAPRDRLVSNPAYAQYCEGLRRRRGGDARVLSADEPDGVVLRATGAASPLLLQRGGEREGEGVASLQGRRHGHARSLPLPLSARRTTNRFLLDPVVIIAQRKFAKMSGSGCLNERSDERNGPSLSLTLRTEEMAAATSRKRERPASHWSERGCRDEYCNNALQNNPMTAAPTKFNENDFVVGIARNFSQQRASSPPPPLPSRRSLAGCFPLELQRHCLEFLTPRYMRTVSTVCASWHRLTCPSPEDASGISSILARAYQASTAVTRAYTTFFQRQWGEQSLPVTLLTSLHRLQLRLLARAADIDVIQHHWQRVRKDRAVERYVQQCLQQMQQLSPLAWLMTEWELEETYRTEAAQSRPFPASGSPSAHTTAAVGDAKRRPLSIELYVLYVLCLGPHGRQSRGHSSTTPDIRSALHAILRAWTAEVKLTDIWTAITPAAAAEPRHSSTSTLLAREAVRQQKLVWTLLTKPPAPSSSTAPSSDNRRTDEEDFVAQLWLSWPAVQKVYDFSTGLH